METCCCDLLWLTECHSPSVCSEDIFSVSSPLTHRKLAILCLYEFSWDVWIFMSRQVFSRSPAEWSRCNHRLLIARRVASVFFSVCPICVHFQPSRWKYEDVGRSNHPFSIGLSSFQVHQMFSVRMQRSQDDDDRWEKWLILIHLQVSVTFIQTWRRISVSPRTCLREMFELVHFS